MKSPHDLIREHLETALYLADGLPTSPAQRMLVDTLTGAMQEVCVLLPRAEERERKTRGV